MTCEYTWPNHLMDSDREATQALLEQHGFQDDVAYGHTKVFIRTPRTLVCLEQERAQLIPIIVLLLQKVGDVGVRGCPGLCRVWGTGWCRAWAKHGMRHGVGQGMEQDMGRGWGVLGDMAYGRAWGMGHGTGWDMVPGMGHAGGHGMRQEVGHGIWGIVQGTVQSMAWERE